MTDRSRLSPGKLPPLDASSFMPGEYQRAEKVYKQMVGADGRVQSKYKGFLRECMLDEHDIQDRNLDAFKEPGVNDQMATLRYNHYQKKRILKLGQIDVMIRNLNAPKSPYRSGQISASHKQEAALRKAIDPVKKGVERKSSSMSMLSDPQQIIDQKAKQLKEISVGKSQRHMMLGNTQQVTSNHNQQAFLTLIPDQTQQVATPRAGGEGPQTTKNIIATKKFSLTNFGGNSIDSNGDKWLQSEVEREKRKIERHISTTERRQEQLAQRDQKLAKAYNEKETKLTKEKKRIHKEREDERLVRVAALAEKMNKGAEKKQGDLDKNAGRAVSQYHSQMKEYKDRHTKKLQHYKQISMDTFNAGREKFKLDNLGGAKKRLAWEQDGEAANMALQSYESRGQRGLALSQANSQRTKAQMGQLYEKAISVHDQHLIQQEQDELHKTARAINSLTKKQQQVATYEKKVKKEKQEAAIKAGSEKQNMSKIIAENQNKDIEKLAYDVMRKQDMIDKRLQNVEKARQQEINLMKERNKLNMEDLQKRTRFQKQYQRLDKLRMIDRQQRLQNVYVRINENKEAQKETARLANEVRLMKMQEGRSLSPRQMSPIKMVVQK